MKTQGFLINLKTHQVIFDCQIKSSRKISKIHKIKQYWAASPINLLLLSQCFYYLLQIQIVGTFK